MCTCFQEEKLLQTEKILIYTVNCFFKLATDRLFRIFVNRKIRQKNEVIKTDSIIKLLYKSHVQNRYTRIYES